MNRLNNLLDLFIHQAEAVSAIVTRVASAREVLDYAVNLCERKEACQLLVAGCEAPLSVPAEALCETKQTKVIAAPGLPPDQLATLNDLCQARGIQCTTDHLRDHLAGIDIGLTYADFGIADTGTLVIDSSSEETRLATMISEIHIAVLPLSRLRASSYALETELQGAMAKAPNYMAFITGASRTADIERVLALGVHGPLELHILILEET
ncbi:MAG: lactate utilization protein [Desulfosarcina sp.]